MAKLYFKYGTMKSGKSIDVIKALINYQLCEQNVLVAKPAIDTRTDGVIASRLGTETECYTLQGHSGEIYDLINSGKNVGIKTEVILVDEAQFLTREQVLELCLISDKEDIPVLCWGLKTNFKGELFEGSKALIEFADKLEEIKTICQFCKHKATMNLRTERRDGSRFAVTTEADEIQIGDEEYIQVCRKDYMKYFDGLTEIPLN